MQLNSVDFLITTSAETLVYTTGIQSVALEMFPHTGAVGVVISADESVPIKYISSRCEIDQIVDADVDLEPVAYGEFYRENTNAKQNDSRIEAIRKAHSSMGISTGYLEAIKHSLPPNLEKTRVAIERSNCNYAVFQELKNTAGAKVCEADALIQAAKKVKSPDEIVKLRQATQVVENAIQESIDSIGPGISEKVLRLTIESAIVQAGGRPKFSLVKSGVGAVGGQTFPKEDPIEKGQAIWFDVGAVIDGYWADVARTAYWGVPSREFLTRYAAIQEGCDAAIREARPGMSGSELFKITVNTVRDCGIPYYRRNHVGHGIGTEVYEPVLVNHRNLETLEPGVVVNIETPYYDFEFGAVHVEDPFVVREDGNTLLSGQGRGLTIVD